MIDIIADLVEFNEPTGAGLPSARLLLLTVFRVPLLEPPDPKIMILCKHFVVLNKVHHVPRLDVFMRQEIGVLFAGTPGGVFPNFRGDPLSKPVVSKLVFQPCPDVLLDKGLKLADNRARLVRKFFVLRL